MNMPSERKHVPALDTFDAGLFDLDGVVTRTASLHFKAWKRLFDDYLERHAEAGAPFRPFGEEDYRRHVDGRPRYDGAAAFLASRGIELPRGDPSDPPDRETVCGLGNRKNALFREILRREGAEVVAGALACLKRLREHGLRLGLVSSSRNAQAVLESAGLTGLFDTVLDGMAVSQLGLRGKPDPDMFLAAAERLGVPPARAFVVEDAVSGVAAGRAGGFGLVVGIGRGAAVEELRRAGADEVQPDLLPLAPGRAPPPFPDRPEDLASLLDGRRPAVFLDYDGTLTPIVDRPDLAILSDEIRAAVRRLARLCPVAVVSGRDRANVERLVALDELIYAGSHGFDIAGPAGLRIEHENGAAFSAAVKRATALLEEGVKGIEGALVEPKAFAVAVHYRLVAEAEVAHVERVVDRVIAEVAELKKTAGKKVFELRPNVEWDKGRAVLWLLDALDLDRSDVLPFYLGDDRTDEDAFRALCGRGVGILVGEPEIPSAADFGVGSTEDVARLLSDLADLLEQTHGK
jgi:trehalose 6-phosphate phosphatase